MLFSSKVPSKSRGLCCVQGITYHRYLYLKKHEVDAAKSTGLFVAGIPFFHQDTRTILKELFEGFGPVRDVVLHPSKVILSFAVCCTNSRHLLITCISCQQETFLYHVTFFKDGN